MKRIMMDLETIDTSPTAAILSIGAVQFDPEAGLGRRFYTALKTDEQLVDGRTYSQRTLKWWSEQSEEARKVFSDPEAKLLYAGLMAFSEYCAKVCDGLGYRDAKLEMWGNGADFDCVILGSAYDTAGLSRPWSYGGNRCYRTLKNIAPNLQAGGGFEREGTHHNALDDAIYQAQYAAAWLNKMGVK